MNGSGFVRIRSLIETRDKIKSKMTSKKLNTKTLHAYTSCNTRNIYACKMLFIITHFLVVEYEGDAYYIFVKECFRPKTCITCQFLFFFLATTSRSTQVIGKNDNSDLYEYTLKPQSILCTRHTL